MVDSGWITLNLADLTYWSLRFCKLSPCFCWSTTYPHPQLDGGFKCFNLFLCFSYFSCRFCPQWLGDICKIGFRWFYPQYPGISTKHCLRRVLSLLIWNRSIWKCLSILITGTSYWTCFLTGNSWGIIGEIHLIQRKLMGKSGEKLE